MVVECFDGGIFGCSLMRGYGGMGWNRMIYRGYRHIWWVHMVFGRMGHALGFVFGCVVCISCEFGCMWYSDVVRLIVQFGWVDIVVGFDNDVRLVVAHGFVVGHMMTKLVGVGQSNTSAQTLIMSL